jgi:hypothetical protein
VILWKLERGKRTVRRMCDPMEALKGGSERPGCVYPMEALKGTLKKKKKREKRASGVCVSYGSFKRGKRDQDRHRSDNGRRPVP